MVFLRAFAVWVILIVVESIHGIFRRLFLEPWIGEFSARQISVFTGSILIVIVTYLAMDWIDAHTNRRLTLTGAMWVLLTVSFEISVGRLALGYTWDRILSDFNVVNGGLLPIGLLIMGFAPRMTASLRRVMACRSERARPLPGDEFIPDPIGSLTHAISIGCSRKHLWPWLVQMGAGRAGAKREPDRAKHQGRYSYDLLDNGGQQSADRIRPEFQKVAPGALFPALPAATDGFVVLAYELERFLVLGANAQDGKQLVTWAFVLDEAGPSRTRLITRARVKAGYRFHGLPLVLVKLIHYVMQRKQLIEIARRAEAARLRRESQDVGSIAS